jgi:hypothetical protein
MITRIDHSALLYLQNGDEISGLLEKYGGLTDGKLS